MASHVPLMAPDDGVIDAAKAVIGAGLVEVKERVGEITLTVTRDALVETLRAPARHAGPRISAADGDRRRRLSRAARAVRSGLSPAVADQEPPHPGQGLDRRSDPGAERHVAVAGRRLARARSVRHVWRGVRGQSRPPPHPHRLRLPGPPAAQGFPAHRLCRAALFRGRKARDLRARQPAAGFPHVRFPDAVGRGGISPARRREGRAGGAGRAVAAPRRRRSRQGAADARPKVGIANVDQAPASPAKPQRRRNS